MPTLVDCSSTPSQTAQMRSCKCSTTVERGESSRIWLAGFFILAIVAYLAQAPSLSAQDVAEKATEQAAESSSQDAVAEPAANADDNESKSEDFLRVRKNEEGKPIALETSITRYTGKNEKGEEIVVDLIGVVHIGEGDYYDDLNKRFEKYDALLYELVAPEGTRIPEGGVREEGFNPISGLQSAMQDMLDLEFQLEKVDYNRGNFVHADMSPAEFAESMSNNDESFAKMFLKMFGQAMAMQGSQASGGSDLSLMMAYFSKDRAFNLRRIMAEQMQGMDQAMTMFEGKDGSTIITHRNGKAFEILKREINNGKKELGVFYGAGHLPDMEQRLFKDFDMERGKREWLIAWKLTRGEIEPAKAEDAADDEPAKAASPQEPARAAAAGDDKSN